jgi:hypothetical protein
MFLLIEDNSRNADKEMILRNVTPNAGCNRTIKATMVDIPHQEYVLVSISLTNGLGLIFFQMENNKVAKQSMIKTAISV